MTSKRFTYKQLQDFLKEKNELDKTTFFLQGAYGDCQLWAKDQQGTDREIERGSPKDCYNAWKVNRFKEKWSITENKMFNRKGKKGMLKEVSEDGTLFSSSNLTITRESGTLKFDFNMPGWFHDSEDPSEAIAIIAGSKFKNEPKIQQIELTDADKNRIDIAEFLYWMSGGNRHWSPGGDNDFNVGWREVEPVIVKRFGDTYLQGLKRCNTLGEMLKYYVDEREGFIQDFWEVASEKGWTDDPEDEYSQQENKRKPMVNKITESRRVSIHKKVRATLKRIIKEEYGKALKESGVDNDAVTELIGHAMNTNKTYDILMNTYVPALMKFKKKGTFDRNKALKLLEYYYQKVRESYKREHGDDIKLDPASRKSFSEQILQELEDEKYLDIQESRSRIKEEYNGWSNYDTWAVSMYLNNEETLYNMLSKERGKLTVQKLQQIFSQLSKYNMKGSKDIDPKEVNWQEIVDTENSEQ